MVEKRPRSIPEIANKALERLKLLPPGPKEQDKKKPCYRPRNPLKSRLRRMIESELDRVFDIWERFQEALGPWKSRYYDAAERFLSCGIFEKGFSLFRPTKPRASFVKMSWL